MGTALKRNRSPPPWPCDLLCRVLCGCGRRLAGVVSSRMHIHTCAEESRKFWRDITPNYLDLFSAIPYSRRRAAAGTLVTVRPLTHGAESISYDHHVPHARHIRSDPWFGPHRTGSTANHRIRVSLSTLCWCHSLRHKRSKERHAGMIIRGDPAPCPDVADRITAAEGVGGVDDDLQPSRRLGHNRL